MLKSKKTISILLALVLVLSVYAGTKSLAENNKEPGSGADGAATAPTTETSDEATTAPTTAPTTETSDEATTAPTTAPTTETSDTTNATDNKEIETVVVIEKIKIGSKEIKGRDVTDWSEYGFKFINEVSENDNKLVTSTNTTVKGTTSTEEKDIINYVYTVSSSKHKIEKIDFNPSRNKGNDAYSFKATVNRVYLTITLKSDEEIDKVTRLEGTDRYETAVEIAKEAYPTAKNVIIANGEVSADALAAGPLANELEAPILLVRNNSAIQGVKNYIRDNGVEKIYVVGGPNSVSKDLLAELLAIDTKIKSERINGKDRYETSIKVATTLKDKGYTNGVIIANGTDAKDADALAASTYATENKMPIVLTNGSVLTTEVKAGLKTIGATNATIIGGPQTVAENIINGTALTYTSEGRISGANRFETSIAIAEKLTQANVKTVVVANGYKSPDALTAGPLAFTKNAAIILSTETDFTSSQNTYIGTIKNIETAYIAGGVNSVKPAVKTALETLVENSRDK
ncbi:cell wall-binding repeat-containing protein [Miniphocaeibacter halophilus]|uniref:Cell wall-binding repeat-containing protein n=1 Tax=Miniphocaeibacter halophilus TaxID=2931922 RepID=A0AC61MX08_9FIRM|nr:cell wall-binding repeat-containing protein [Miniphocaeibacter halophilus]QQK08224.1 cell wall-binding repeat-containing protein [Miniphocaeibacter halophilus]